MSVHYKFKSTLDYDTITFDGLHISVADLKKAILQQKRLNRIDFDLQIVNAQTKEEYQHENTLIPKNTSLIISRVPLANPTRKQHWEKQSRKVPLFPTRPLIKPEDVDLYKMEGSEEQKIDAMIAQTAGLYDPKTYHKIRPFPQTGEVPITYRCNKCKRGGHWIKNCPYNISKEHSEVKRTTGIPKSFIDKEDRLLLIQSKEPLIEEEQKQEIPDDLICSICNDLFVDAVMIPCCGTSFCDDCVRCALLESEENECPDCKEKGCSPEALIPNRFLRKSVNSFKNSTGYKTPLLQKNVQKKDNAVNAKASTPNESVKSTNNTEKRDESISNNEQNKQKLPSNVDTNTTSTVVVATTTAVAVSIAPFKEKEAKMETSKNHQKEGINTQEKTVDIEKEATTPDKKKEEDGDKQKENDDTSLVSVGIKHNDEADKKKDKEKDKEMLSPNHEESDYEDNIVVTIMPPIDNLPADKYLHNPHPRHGPHTSHLINSPINKQISSYQSDGGIGGGGNLKDWDHNLRDKYSNEHHENVLNDNIHFSPERPRALLQAPDTPLHPPGVPHSPQSQMYGPIMSHQPYADMHNAQPRAMGPRPPNMHPGYLNTLNNRGQTYTRHSGVPLLHQHCLYNFSRARPPHINAYNQFSNSVGTLTSGYPSRYVQPNVQTTPFNYQSREVPDNAGINYSMRPYSNLSSVYEEVQAKVGVGIIDDPLEAFNRIMKEKEKKKDERRSPERRRRSKERHIRKPFRQSPCNYRMKKDLGHYYYHDKRARSRDHEIERGRWNQYAKDHERESDRERDRNRKLMAIEQDKRERDKEKNYRSRRSKSFEKRSRSRSHSPKRHRGVSPGPQINAKNYNINEKYHQQKFRHNEAPAEDIDFDSRYKHGKSSTIRFQNSKDGNRYKHIDKIEDVREPLNPHQQQHLKRYCKLYDEESEPPPPGSEVLSSYNLFNDIERNLSPPSRHLSSNSTYCRDNEEDWLNMRNPTPDLYEKCVSQDLIEHEVYTSNRRPYSRSPVHRISHGNKVSSRSRTRSPALSYDNDKYKRYKRSTTPRGQPGNTNNSHNNKKDKNKEEMNRYAGCTVNHNVLYKSEDKDKEKYVERKDHHQQRNQRPLNNDDINEDEEAREVKDKKRSMTPVRGKVDTKTVAESPETESDSRKTEKKLKDRKKKRKEKKDNRKPKKEKKAKKERYKSKSQEKEDHYDKDEEEEDEDDENPQQQEDDTKKSDSSIAKQIATMNEKEVKLEINQKVSDKSSMNLITKVKESSYTSDNFDIDKLKAYDQQNNEIIGEKCIFDKVENTAIINDSNSTQATTIPLISKDNNITMQSSGQQHQKSTDKRSPPSMSTTICTENIKSFDAVLDIHEYDIDFDEKISKGQDNTVLNKLVPEASKWEIEEPQSDNLAAICNNAIDNTQIDFPYKSLPTVESNAEKITNDIIVLAEKAIFARAINAIRPIEIRNKSISQERNNMVTGNSSHYHLETSSDIKNIQITLPLMSTGHKERSVELKNTENFVEQKKKSIKERLGSKVTQQVVISQINDVYREGDSGGNGNGNTDCESENTYKRSFGSSSLDSKVVTKYNEFENNYHNNDHHSYTSQLQQPTQSSSHHYEKDREREREREHNTEKQKGREVETDWPHARDKSRNDHHKGKDDDHTRNREHNRHHERERERSHNSLKSKVNKDNLQPSYTSSESHHLHKITSEHSTSLRKATTTHKRSYESRLSASPRRKRKSSSSTSSSGRYNSRDDDNNDNSKRKQVKLDKRSRTQYQHSDTSDSDDASSKKSKKRSRSSKKKKKSHK